jgi:hypothetical protein
VAGARLPRPGLPTGLLLQQIADFFQQQFTARRGRRLCHYHLGWWPLQPVEPLDRHEDHEGNDQEVEHRLEEGAVLEQDGGVIGSSPYLPGQIREINAGQQLAQRRHHHIGHQRRDNLAEGRTDDDAHGHVDDIALHGKFLELRCETHFSSLDDWF